MASSEMLDGLVALALAAGTEILAIYGGVVETSDKADGSPVTAADVRAEAVIAEGLAGSRPTFRRRRGGDRRGRVPETHGKFFLVDPLDGTREFISRNGEFTVNIALVEAGRPVLGVVYAPALGEIFVGAEGEGARAGTLDDRGDVAWSDIAVREPDAAGLDVLASRSHLTAETKDFIDRFKVRDLVSAGSSLKFCRLAAGEADLYPRLGRTMEWDTAAGDAVLRRRRPHADPRRRGPSLRQAQPGLDSDFANPWFVAAGRFDPLRVGAAETV